MKMAHKETMKFIIEQSGFIVSFSDRYTTVRRTFWQKATTPLFFFKRRLAYALTHTLPLDFMASLVILFFFASHVTSLNVSVTPLANVWVVTTS